jgi:hypothetical protein
MTTPTTTYSNNVECLPNAHEAGILNQKYANINPM